MKGYAKAPAKRVIAKPAFEIEEVAELPGKKEEKDKYSVLNTLLNNHIKDAQKKKQIDKEQVLSQLLAEYKKWVTASGPEQITANYNKFNKYYRDNLSELKKVLHERERTSLSGHKLETFTYHLLKGMAESFDLDIRQSKIVSWMGFAPLSSSDFADGKIIIKQLNMSGDLVIGKDLTININGIEQKKLIPLVIVSCKAYIDFTILRGLVQEAEEILNANPKAIFFAIAETDHLGIINKEIIERWSHKIRGFFIFRQNAKGEETEDMNVDSVREFYEIVYSQLKKYAPLK